MPNTGQNLNQATKSQMPTSQLKAIGLHFGHDASISTFSDTEVFYSAHERSSRIKHAIGLETEEVLSVLGQGPNVVNISSTQGIPIFFDSTLVDLNIQDAQPISARSYLDSLDPHSHYLKRFAWSEKIQAYSGLFIPEDAFGWRHPAYEGYARNYETLSMVSHNLDFSQGVKKPGRMILKDTGEELSINYWQHHYLHAMYAAGSAGNFKPSLIVTADGATGPSYEGGGIYFFHPESGLRPIVPTNGWIGGFYDSIAYKLGLGWEGAGKLMGLAPYGKPIYFSETLVGTRDEITNQNVITIGQAIDLWLRDIGYQTEYADWNKAVKNPPKVVADIAASAQLIFEINQLKLTEAAIQIAKKCDFRYEAIIYSGGCALNCPANSHAHGIYNNVLIPPAVNDEGLAIGLSIIGWREATKAWPSVNLSSPYIGYSISYELMAHEAAKRGYTLVKENALETCIQRLMTNEAIAVVDGKSEVGPRALGHRSLIGNPASETLWENINKAKRREMWRPLAPVVLQSHLRKYFDCGPDLSPYMLFNYRVVGKQFPAVTHYDHSARVQTVNAEPETFSQILRYMDSVNIPPVILNTSLNGPGVPIAETEVDIFDVADDLGISTIYMPGAIFIKA